ncbi:MAG TPA: hypothetical protein VIK91_03265 [Nannocystis sp.]
MATIRAYSKLHLKVSRELADLRVARTQADYDAVPQVLQVKAISALSDARALIRLVDELRARRGGR